MELSRVKPKYHIRQNKLPNIVPLIGCIYMGEEKDGTTIQGILLSINGEQSTLSDTHGTHYIVRTSLLKSVYM